MHSGEIEPQYMSRRLATIHQAYCAVPISDAWMMLLAEDEKSIGFHLSRPAKDKHDKLTQRQLFDGLVAMGMALMELDPTFIPPEDRRTELVAIEQPVSDYKRGSHLLIGVCFFEIFGGEDTGLETQLSRLITQGTRIDQSRHSDPTFSTVAKAQRGELLPKGSTGATPVIIKALFAKLRPLYIAINLLGRMFTVIEIRAMKDGVLHGEMDGATKARIEKFARHFETQFHLNSTR